MLALKIIGIIFIVLFLINSISIGADIGYENEEFKLSAKCCGVLLQILPKDESKKKPENTDEKKKKKKKDKKPKDTKPENETESKGAETKDKKKKFDFNVDELLELLKVVVKGLGSFFRKFKVDRFLLDYTGGGSDPYAAAQTFNYVNAALSVLYPICKKRYAVKDSYVHTDLDFTLEKMKIDFGIAFSIRIGQIFGFVFRVAFGALRVLIKNKIRLFREKRAAKKEEKSGSTVNDSIERIET